MTQPRASQPTIGFIDQYCRQYQSIFPEVRSYEAFKRILIGIITPSQRKSLSRIAKIVGLVWMLKTEKVRQNKWRKFERVFCDGHTEIRYVSEVIFGHRRSYTFWYVTTDPETLPENSTSFVMTNIPDISYQDIGNIYGLRTWVEYGFKQCKSELGWADFTLTKYADIAKWWELICCAFLLISSLAPSPQPSKPVQLSTCQAELESYLAAHPDWQIKSGWKSMLNNVQLLLVPLLAFNLVKPWLRVFNNPLLVSSFLTLISLVNLCANAFLNRDLTTIHSFSSA